MYRPGKEMKARYNMQKCAQRTQPQMLRIIKKKNPKGRQMLKNDRHKISGKTNFREFPTKHFSKDGKIKSQNPRKLKSGIIHSVDQNSNH